jgi:hypothetical protein
VTVAPGYAPGFTATVVAAAATVVAYRLLVSPMVRDLARVVTVGNRVPARVRALRLAAAAVTVAGLSAVVALTGDAPDAGPLRWPILVALLVVTWRTGTTDYDLRRSTGPQAVERIAVVALAVAAAVWPLLLLAWFTVACGRIMAWQHHAMLAIRILKAYLAWFIAICGITLVAPEPYASGAHPALLLVLGCVSLSHYFKPAWSKARLGKWWWSWAWENRTHYLMAAAYNWGWARFLPAGTVSRILRVARHLDRPLNILTMFVEAAPLIAFLDRRLLVVVLLATVAMHVAIFVSSGILFWESLCVNAVLALTVASLPQSPYESAFGPAAAGFAVLILVLCVTDRLWQPFHLGWWDSPYTARVVWQAETASGKVQGVYNNFMCPFEREFGRFAGYFLSREPLLHGPLGGLFDRTVRDRIVDARGDLEKIDELKRTHGKTRWDPEMATAHLHFLREMFTRLNAGARKGPLPARLRWLKAPGGQVFYWGDLPSYRGREPVSRIVIRCQERCYFPDTNTFALLRDRVLAEIDLRTTPPRWLVVDDMTHIRRQTAPVPQMVGE